MAFDGLVTRAVVDECKREIISGRISKIYQPTNTDIVLQIRAGGANKRLLLSANLTYPRFHLTKESSPNPTEAPMFCMLLRKHCEGAIIEKIQQTGMERVIHIDLRARDELGDWKIRRIVVEIMGRHSNILLLDAERNLILDSIHHLTPGISRHRVVLPGRNYTPPPEQIKKDPLAVSKESFIAAMDFNTGRMDKQLVDHFTGLSPLVSREITSRAHLGSRDELWEAFSTMMEDIKNQQYLPQIVEVDNKSVFSVVDLSHLQGNKRTYDSISECLQVYYFGRSDREAVRQKAHDLLRFVSNELEKNKKKLIKLEDTRQNAHKADEQKKFGELITAYMHQIKKGDTVAEVANYYEEDTPLLLIPLDPLKTPAENAQTYFKKYNKAKNSLTMVEEQLKLAHIEINYFEGIYQQLEGASLLDIVEIREELAEGGYLRLRGKKGNRKKKNDKPQIEKYVSSEGVEIMVGKNNKQNEYLTNRLASSTDTWLHTKDIPGSHVVIRARDFTEETLTQAATIAAYYSQARGSNQVPVDYTFVRHVRKPSGAKPGFVIYDHQKTLYVKSDESVIRELKQK